MYRATPVSTKLSRSLDDEREQPSQTETLVARSGQYVKEVPVPQDQRLCIRLSLSCAGPDMSTHPHSPRDCSTRLLHEIAPGYSANPSHDKSPISAPPPPRLLELLHERRAANGLIVSTVSPSKPYRGQTGNKDQESDDKASGTPAFSNG
ncbi:hypothetical protein PABG_12395 [Paracoccidioides brasiliensis Pb03]|nr:hypothetical protein PABG_12395 [Paracoccidioides brasiliensis Pb03]